MSIINSSWNHPAHIDGDTPLTSQSLMLVSILYFLQPVSTQHLKEAAADRFDVVLQCNTLLYCWP